MRLFHVAVHFDEYVLADSAEAARAKAAEITRMGTYSVRAVPVVRGTDPVGYGKYLPVLHDGEASITLESAWHYCDQ